MALNIKLVEEELNKALRGFHNLCPPQSYIRCELYKILQKLGYIPAPEHAFKWGRGRSRIESDMAVYKGNSHKLMCIFEIGNYREGREKKYREAKVTVPVFFVIPQILSTVQTQIQGLKIFPSSPRLKLWIKSVEEE